MANPQRNAYAYGIDEINQFRKSINLPPVKQGNRVCLKCGKTFHSDDLNKNRICYPCLQTNDMNSQV